MHAEVVYASQTKFPFFHLLFQKTRRGLKLIPLLNPLKELRRKLSLTLQSLRDASHDEVLPPRDKLSVDLSLEAARLGAEEDAACFERDNRAGADVLQRRR